MSRLMWVCISQAKLNTSRCSYGYSFIAIEQRRCYNNKYPRSEMNKKPSPPISSSCLPSTTKAPPPPKKPNYLLWLLSLAAGGAGMAYYLKMYGTVPEEEIKEEHVKVLRQKTPATSQEIPKEVPYLLIGGGTASFSAFRAIKSNDPKAKVLVISNEIEMPYMRPPLSKELWLSGDLSNTDKLQFRQWNGIERSLYYEPDDFYVHPTKLLDEPNGGVAIVRGYTVKHIDVYRRKAVLTDGTEISYEECLLATGSQPKNLDLFRAAPLRIQNKITLYKTIEDFVKLKSIMNQRHSVAIIGGGFLGSELACALAKYGESRKLKVFQIFHEKGNMGKILPQYLSEWTTNRIREEGVSVIPETQVEAVDEIGSQLELKLNNGQNVLVDHVIVAIGSEPNVGLAKESGLEVDNRHGGYVVNAELEARRHLFVAGDAACFYDPKLGRRRVEHHDHAVVSGRLAGENMVGKKKPYQHQSMFWSDLGPKVGYEAIGLIDSSLPTIGVFAKASSKDTPASSGSNNLNTSESTEPQTNASSPATPPPFQNDCQENDAKIGANENDTNYGKGVVFYLRDEKVVGIVLWNVFNRINIARLLISEGKRYDDLNEVAKLFDIHA